MHFTHARAPTITLRMRTMCVSVCSVDGLHIRILYYILYLYKHERHIHQVSLLHGRRTEKKTTTATTKIQCITRPPFIDQMKHGSTSYSSSRRDILQSQLIHLLTHTINADRWIGDKTVDFVVVVVSFSETTTYNSAIQTKPTEVNQKRTKEMKKKRKQHIAEPTRERPSNGPTTSR